MFIKSIMFHILKVMKNIISKFFYFFPKAQKLTCLKSAFVVGEIYLFEYLENVFLHYCYYKHNLLLFVYYDLFKM